jgi:hypothetical protein
VELSGGRLGNVNPLINTQTALETAAGRTHAPAGTPDTASNPQGTN